MKLSRHAPLLFLVALALPAQTLVEYSLGTAGAAGAAAGMRGIGKATAALMDRATKTLETAPKSAGTVIVPPKSGAPAAVVRLSPPPDPAALKLSPAPDPAAVKIGMDAQEVIARFGKPAMKVSSSDDSQLLETWSYGSPPNEVTLTLRNGKVSAVSAASQPKEARLQEVTVLQ
ncbi:MAG: hypothetical protein ABSE56_16030 [Bryobacteraceae bacterium]|jgi:hypothetical protein